MQIHCFIFSWQGHQRAAAQLERRLSRLGRATVVNSEAAAVKAHPHWVHLGERAYFSAQWNAAVRLFAGDILLHIQADANMRQFGPWVEKGLELFRRKNIAIYEPDIRHTDFIYDRRQLRRLGRDRYEVPLTDSTCWMLHGEIIRKFPRIDLRTNAYGWGIPAVAAAIARSIGRICARDYAFVARHPRGRGYSADAAMGQRLRYFRRLPPPLRRRIEGIYRERWQTMGGTPHRNAQL